MEAPEDGRIGPPLRRTQPVPGLVAAVGRAAGRTRSTVLLQAPRGPPHGAAKRLRTLAGRGWSGLVSRRGFGEGGIASPSRPGSSRQRRTCWRAGQPCHEQGRAAESGSSARISSTKDTLESSSVGSPAGCPAGRVAGPGLPYPLSGRGSGTCGAGPSRRVSGIKADQWTCRDAPASLQVGQRGRGYRTCRACRSGGGASGRQDHRVALKEAAAARHRQRRLRVPRVGRALSFKALRARGKPCAHGGHATMVRRCLSKAGVLQSGQSCSVNADFTFRQLHLLVYADLAA